MSLESTDILVSASGDGATLNFTFNKYFLSNSDLVVLLVDDTTKAETLQTITTHYTVSGAGDDGGGTVTFVTAPPVGKTVVIYRDPAITQTFDPEPTGPVSPDSIETELDRRTMVEQRLNFLIERGIRLPDGFTASFDTKLPGILTADTLIKINSDGDGFEIITPESLALLSDGLSTTDDLAEGGTNLYYTDARVDSRLGVLNGRVYRAWVEHAVTGGQSATDLTDETIDSDNYSSAHYLVEIIRGTTIFAVGNLSIQNLNGTWRVMTGLFMADEAHGVTFSVGQSGTVGTLKAALTAGDNGTIKLSRILIPA